MLAAVRSDKPAQALEGALAGLADEYDGATAAFVALQMEFPWPLQAAQDNSR
jgi:hypothetical protein